MRITEVKILEMDWTLECAVRIPEITINDRVLVEKDKIIYLGKVLKETKVLQDTEKSSRPIPECSIIRKLFPFETGEAYIRYKIENEGMDFCKKNIEILKLDMKLLRVRYILSENKLVFYYSAEERVDFRELVKILAARFHLRIEMRQINIRDECKILGGIGVCGRACCCATILNEMSAVTSKITRMQCQNTSNYVGYCGRLLCCLAFDPLAEEEENICNYGTGYTAVDENLQGYVKNENKKQINDINKEDKINGS